ncbi:hypothetical protein RND81_04G064000 [Saponaria officinalis]|uniref:Secreted protein n=1 Tax=Saponaria officinalis TaxID=3572 RepID=A0AAW1LIM8_SAPOF
MVSKWVKQLLIISALLLNCCGQHISMMCPSFVAVGTKYVPNRCSTSSSSTIVPRISTSQTEAILLGMPFSTTITTFLQLETL